MRRCRSCTPDGGSSQWPHCIMSVSSKGEFESPRVRVWSWVCRIHLPTPPRVYNTDNGVISMHPVSDLDTYFGHSEEAIAEVVDFDIWSSRRKISGHNIDEGRGFTSTPMRRLVLCRVLAIPCMHLVNIMFSRWCPLYPHRRLQDF